MKRISKPPWSRSVDHLHASYFRIRDQGDRAIARVYSEGDAQLIVNAPGLLELVQRMAAGDLVPRSECRRFLEEAYLS